MQIKILGTNSGAEPLPGRFHSAFAVEHAGGWYWFDAGETCSYNAHLAGIDLLAVRAIFITHTHMDHIGGLANLLWNIRKLNGLRQNPAEKLTGKTIPVYLPNQESWQGILQLLRQTEGGFELDYRLDGRSVQDGVLFADAAGFQVQALHNRHMGEPAPGDPWRSFSFRIEAGQKSIVYSGDIRHVSELEPLLEGADLVLMETGHHLVPEVCQYLVTCGRKFGRLIFTHHGRDTIKNLDQRQAEAIKILGPRVQMAHDGLSLTL